MLSAFERLVTAAKHSLKNAIIPSLSGDTFPVLCLQMSEPMFQKAVDGDSERFINHNVSVTESGAGHSSFYRSPLGGTQVVTSGCRSGAVGDRAGSLTFDYKPSREQRKAWPGASAELCGQCYPWGLTFQKEGSPRGARAGLCPPGFTFFCCFWATALWVSPEAYLAQI